MDRGMNNAYLYRDRFYSKDRTKIEMTLDYLEKFKTITPLEALKAFGSFRLADTIYTLKKRGYTITTTLSDEGYAIYRLEF